jgi:hypothetical protein
MGLGKLRDKAELRNSRKVCAIYIPGTTTEVQFVVHIEYLICFSIQGVRLAEGMSAHNPRLPLTCITRTHEVVCDCIAFT